MVTITLYVRQQKRHRCIKQSFGPCGRGTGWDDLGEWHWNMYNIRNESPVQVWYRMLGAGALGWPRGMVQGRRMEEGSGWGTHVYLWQIHVDIWQNQYNIVKLKNKIKKFKKMIIFKFRSWQRVWSRYSHTSIKILFKYKDTWTRWSLLSYLKIVVASGKMFRWETPLWYTG